LIVSPATLPKIVLAQTSATDKDNVHAFGKLGQAIATWPTGCANAGDANRAANFPDGMVSRDGSKRCAQIAF
jgi:hypothetical protein